MVDILFNPISEMRKLREVRDLPKDTELVTVQSRFEIRYDSRAYALNHATFLPAGLVKMKKIDSIQCAQSCKDIGTYTFLLQYQLVQTFGGQFGRRYQSCQFASSFDHSWKSMTQELVNKEICTQVFIIASFI